MKYKVTLFYSTFIEVEVQADDREDAVDEACYEAGKDKYNPQFLHNAEFTDAEVEEIQ